MEIATLILIAGSAVVAIYAEEADPRRRRLVYLFKPLTTVFIVFLAYQFTSVAGNGYARAILIGLGLSLAGDIFLMLPQDRFLAGLIAFLLAHIAYLVAFTRFVPLLAVPVAFLVVGLAEAVILGVLWPGIPRRLRGPVVIYVLVLGMMAAQAVSQGVALAVRPAWLAALGGAIFVFSDSALAFDRFRRPFRRARLVVLASYWAAQTLIALSMLTPLALHPWQRI